MSEQMPQMIVPNEQCEVSQTSFTNFVYDIYLDEGIREPSYYRQALHVIRTASQGDRINLMINNGGGRLDSAISFVNALRDCEAEVVAVLEGETHSASSMIALSCHGVHVKPYASMMIHNASLGSGGTIQNVMDHINFTSKQTERLIRDVYKYFLTESEIEEVIRNREVWLDEDQIGERLENMFQMRAEEQQSCGEVGCETCSEGDFNEINLEEMIDSAVESGVQKALDKILKKFDLSPKAPKPARKKVESKIDKVVVENVEAFNSRLEKLSKTEHAAN